MYYLPRFLDSCENAAALFEEMSGTNDDMSGARNNAEWPRAAGRSPALQKRLLPDHAMYRDSCSSQCLDFLLDTPAPSRAPFCCFEVLHVEVSYDWESGIAGVLHCYQPGENWYNDAKWSAEN